MPESPVWLIVKRETTEEAEQVLRRIRSNSEFRSEIAELVEYKQSQQREPPTTKKLKIMLKETRIRRALISIKINRSEAQIIVVFRCLFLAGGMMQVLQQLSGINTFMYYSASIFESAGIGSTSQVIWLATIPAAANFIFTFVGMALVERVRTKLIS